MKIIEPSVEFVNAPDYQTLMKTIEAAGRTCYKSEDLIKDGSAEEMVRKFLSWGHESPIEHASVTVRIICDRGVSHEIVRHRLASYSQESTRYCNYSKDKFGREIMVIRPCTICEDTDAYRIWKRCCENSELAYFDMLDAGCTPQEARSVLPNSLKTEVVMTANMREWRHFFKLRTTKGAHPDMRKVALMLLDKFEEKYPAFFDNLLDVHTERKM
ncbi:MAG: FAD-dependent thymidylate synthase [Pseudomonadota bacterium]|nr:FAD-dependent thymidylate synthase [Pseudomonadota bacterium]